MAVRVAAGDTEVGRGETVRGGGFEIAIGAGAPDTGRFRVGARWSDPDSGREYAGWSSFELSADQVALPPILLVPSRALAVRVLLEDRLAKDAVVELWVGEVQGEGGFSLEAAGPDGVARFAAAPRRQVVAVASVPGVGYGVTNVPDFASTATVRVEAGRSAVLLVREASMGDPVAGARVRIQRDLSTERVRAFGPAPGIAREQITRSDGTIRLAGIGTTDTLRLELLSAPGLPVRGRHRPAATLPPGTTRVVLDAPSPRTVRFPIEAGQPEDGATIRIRSPFPLQPLPDCVRAKLDGSELVVTGLPPEACTFIARSSDGRVVRAVAPAALHQGAGIEFVRERAVTVEIEDANGPVAGAGVRLRLQGSAPISTVIATDEQGRARIEGLDAWLRRGNKRDSAPHFEIVVLEVFPFWPHEDARRAVAKLTLDPETQTRAVRLPAETRLTATFRRGGSPCLPSSYLLHYPGLLEIPIREDPQAGESEYRVRPLSDNQDVPARLACAGSTPQSARVEHGRVEFDLNRR